MENPNGPKGIAPDVVARVLRWAADVVLIQSNPETESLAEDLDSDDDDGQTIDETFSDVLSRMAVQQEGRAEYLANNKPREMSLETYLDTNG